MLSTSGEAASKSSAFLGLARTKSEQPLRLMFSVDLQSERILAWGFTPDILQILHLQSCGAVWLTLLLVQNEELALLHAGILLLC